MFPPTLAYLLAGLTGTTTRTDPPACASPRPAAAPRVLQLCRGPPAARCLTGGTTRREQREAPVAIDRGLELFEEFEGLLTGRRRRGRQGVGALQMDTNLVVRPALRRLVAGVAVPGEGGIDEAATH